MPLFSVIVPTYNRAVFLCDALSSVRSQTFTDWECIVIDDGSTDETKTVVRDITAADPRIRLIERSNGGPGAARNQGAAAAKGRYLAFLDSDDVWLPHTLSVYRDALEQRGWPEYLAGQFRTFSDSTDPPTWPIELLRTDTFPDAIAACDKGQVIAGVGISVVSTDAFRRSNGFLEDRMNAEDHDFTMRIGDCNGFAAVRAPITVGYRRHGDQETQSHQKAVAGVLRLIEREKAGVYPGGESRKAQRQAIIAAHARPVCVAALNDLQLELAWSLYRATLPWQVQARRWKFVLGFPILYFKELVAAWSLK